MSPFQPNSNVDEYHRWSVTTIGYGNLENNEPNEQKQLREISIASYTQR